MRTRNGMQRASGVALAGSIFGRSPARTLALLQAAWPLAVGSELARRTRAVAADGGTLRVRVPDAGWRKVLHRMQPEILSRLRDIAGDLAPRRLAFIDAPFPEEPPEDTPAAPGEPPPAPAAVAQGAAAIVDPEIRDRFLSTAARYLSRRKGPAHD